MHNSTSDVVQLKNCYKCKLPKELTEFYKNRSKKDGHGDICKLCDKAYQEEHYRSNPEAKTRKIAYARTYQKVNYASVRDLALQRMYGISSADWEVLFNSQGRKCAACGATEPRGGKWDTDHCHKTGKVCGIICQKCNVVCGQAEDDFEIARACATYLYVTRSACRPIKETP